MSSRPRSPGRPLPTPYLPTRKASHPASTLQGMAVGGEQTSSVRPNHPGGGGGAFHTCQAQLCARRSLGKAEHQPGGERPGRGPGFCPVLSAVGVVASSRSPSEIQ